MSYFLRQPSRGCSDRRRGPCFFSSPLSSWPYRYYSPYRRYPPQPQYATEPVPEPTPEPAAPVKAEPLNIFSFDVLKATNATTNHTAAYDTDRLVLRRGNDFRVKFNLSRPLDKNTDALNVEFKRGLEPNFRNGTRFECLVERKAVREWEWKGTIQRSEGNEVEAVVHVPVDAPVGEYEVVAEAVHLDTLRQATKEANVNVVILFNPWDKEDDVYVEDDDARKEYVMNGQGKIWAGSYKSTFTWPWEFEQFESYSLNAALYLLDRFGLDSELRRSPVHVSRTCATMVNANDNDGGILVGNWSGNYAPHTSPSSWSGSGAILEQFWRTKKSVMYAQCWVFGGTLTSVLRTLGIPARPITNFASAHDTDANRSIDFYLDSSYKAIDHLTNDSIWNYHVWVEGWMERPDLKGGVYGGWQALDATPQEPSPDTPGNMFTLGPCPISAIKEGKNMKYDAEFVISEVNADAVYYLYNQGNPKLLMTKRDTVGKHISTKSILSDVREDITERYKFPEGSMSERAALEGSGGGQVSDVSIVVEAPDNIQFGANLEGKVVFRSEATVSRGVQYQVVLRPVSYIGALGPTMKTLKADIAVGPKGVVEVPIRLTPEEYVGKVSEQLLVDITVFASVPDREAFLLEKETFRFRTPDLDLAAPAGMKAGEASTVTASFRNPLDQVLTNVEWFVEGAGLTKPLTLDGRSVAARGQASVQFNITAKNDVEPTRSLTVTFESAQLEGVMGSVQVQIN
nr:protein-glutamine gamma-glutamyltransferase K-like isoform X3 [Halisarca dujardinii]